MATFVDWRFLAVVVAGGLVAFLFSRGLSRLTKRRAPSTTASASLLATTDDPCDDLAAHRRLTEDPTWTGRVIPTFRPDRYHKAATPTWNVDLDRLAEVSGQDTGSCHGFLAALEDRRSHFTEHGAVSTDRSHLDARTDVLDPAEAARLFDHCRHGDITAEEGTALRRHLVSEMARMSVDDGLVTRNDNSRRLDAGYLATLVAEHRLEEDEALETAHDLVVANPSRAFKL